MITHLHHMVPKHMGGGNESSNLVRLTVEEHAEAHKALYEKFGIEADKIAWLALTGQIGSEEARLMALRAAIPNRDMSFLKTKQYRELMSERMMGRPYVNKKGPWKRTKEANEKISKAHQGNQYGVGNRGNFHPHPLVTCTYCGKQGKGPVMRRYHFDNCKNRNN